MIYNQSENTNLAAASDDVLTSRKNIYDNDEFDVFNQPSKVDLSRVHIGKRDREVSSVDDPLLKEKVIPFHHPEEISNSWSYFTFIDFYHFFFMYFF